MVSSVANHVQSYAQAQGNRAAWAWASTWARAWRGLEIVAVWAARMGVGGAHGGGRGRGRRRGMGVAVRAGATLTGQLLTRMTAS